MGEQQKRGVAMAAALGLSQAAFSRRATGELKFSVDEIEDLADLFGVSEEYLMGFSESRNPRPGPDGGDEVVRHQGLEPRTRWLSVCPPLGEDLAVDLADVIAFPQRLADAS